MLTNDDMNVEIEAVKRAMIKNKKLRIDKRYMVILSYLQGYLNNEIAEIECIQTITKIIRLAKMAL